jgi:hypothetical protein
MQVTVHLDRARYQRWQKVLRRKTPIKGVDDILDTVTMGFPDLFCVVVKLCNGRPPYVDVVLFTPKGDETNAVVCEPFPGTIEMDKKHTVEIAKGDS